MADTMDLFAEVEPPAPVDPLDEIAERRRQQEQDRNPTTGPTPRAPLPGVRPTHLPPHPADAHLGCRRRAMPDLHGPEPLARAAHRPAPT